MKKCKICGKFDNQDLMVDVEPKGICTTCMSRNMRPEHIPFEQRLKYYEILIRKHEDEKR